jgi:hypothetical protein
MVIGTIVRANVNGMGWGMAFTWPLLVARAWWLFVVWLGMVAIAYTLFQLVRDYAPWAGSDDRVDYCRGRCCAVRKT